jgi:hypothetical protein
MKRQRDARLVVVDRAALVRQTSVEELLQLLADENDEQHKPGDGVKEIHER